MFLLPLAGMAVNAETTLNKTQAEAPAVEVAVKKVDVISANPKDQIIDVNIKKSKDITSVKAYIRSLQLKRQETLMS